MNSALEPSRGWKEKLDEHIIDIQSTLLGRQLNSIKKYLMNRTIDENVHGFLILNHDPYYLTNSYVVKHVLPIMADSWLNAQACILCSPSWNYNYFEDVP